MIINFGQRFSKKQLNNITDCSICGEKLFFSYNISDPTLTCNKCDYCLNFEIRSKYYFFDDFELKFVSCGDINIKYPLSSIGHYMCFHKYKIYDDKIFYNGEIIKSENNKKSLKCLLSKVKNLELLL